MKPVDVIKELSLTSGRLEKEEIVARAWENKCYDFFKGVTLAYNGMITFGIKKIPLIEDDEGEEVTNPLTFTQFEVLTRKLSARELTGNAAKKAVQDCALASTTEEWNLWYRRILLKDLECGISESTVNTVLERIAKTDNNAKEYLTPVFSCQLASPSEKHQKKMVGEHYLDIKLDGVRLLTVLNKEKREIYQLTREGRQNNNFTYICEALEPLLDIIPYSLILDGEIVASNFQELMTQLNRKKKVNTNNASLALFDIIPLVDFLNGECKTTQTVRHQQLVDLSPSLQEYTKGRVYVIPKRKVNLSTPQGNKEFLEFNREALLGGYEGVMIKDPNAPYKTKRVAAWLKLKPYIEVSLSVVGFEEGTGERAGTLGAIQFEGEDEGKPIRVSVGSGYSDEMLDEIWNNRDKYMGFIGEIRADGYTQNRNTDEWWSLRFPRFKGWRGTRPGEKL